MEQRKPNTLTLEKDYNEIRKCLEAYCFVKYKMSKDEAEDHISNAIIFHLEHPERFDSTKSSLLTYLQLKCSNFILDRYRSSEHKRLMYVGNIYDVYNAK